MIGGCRRLRRRHWLCVDGDWTQEVEVSASGLPVDSEGG